MEDETKGGGREREKKECFVFAESGIEEKMNYLGSLSDIYIYIYPFYKHFTNMPFTYSSSMFKSSNYFPIICHLSSINP
jgi:hypothetical protein